MIIESGTLDYDVMIDNEEFIVFYEVNHNGILLTTVHDGEFYKLLLIDTFEDYYDEYELHQYLGTLFADYVVEEKMKKVDAMLKNLKEDKNENRYS